MALVETLTLVAGAIGAWFVVQKSAYELSQLWRDRLYRQAQRAIEFAKAFPDEAAFQIHAKRRASAALLNSRLFSHEQRMALLAIEDSEEQVRRAQDLRKWLALEVGAGKVEWSWRRADLADPRQRKTERWKLFGWYLVFVLLAFSPFGLWRLMSGRTDPPGYMFALMVLCMVVFLGLAMTRPFHAGKLSMAARFMQKDDPGPA